MPRPVPGLSAVWMLFAGRFMEHLAVSLSQIAFTCLFSLVTSLVLNGSLSLEQLAWVNCSVGLQLGLQVFESDPGSPEMVFWLLVFSVTAHCFHIESFFVSSRSSLFADLRNHPITSSCLTLMVCRTVSTTIALHLNNDHSVRLLFLGGVHNLLEG